MPSTVTTTLESRSQITTEKYNGSPVNGQDDKFFWSYTEEPHRTRRQAIIKAHPE
ncbi:MAG: hypothetical protein Q9187_008326, partial [Circinaria calcarea]